ncbi:MAG: 3-oxoacid CoA-transferase [Bdellovibrionales bacterium]|nr:3-oxoacid CoA-transferase [Bdellovibrionales bacterium]
MSKYNKMELMVCVASRQLENGSSAAIGTGVPCAAGMLAQKLHAPDLLIFFEAGSAGPILPPMPVSVGDSRTTHKAVLTSTMLDTMETAQRGMIDYTFLGGAQIDCYGNLNSTMIGTDYNNPKVRFPGSGGANDLGSLCRKIMVVTPHDPRRFVKKVDFITTPGYLDGAGAREKAGLSPESGPYKVITDLAILDFEETSKKMRVISLHPGVTFEMVQESTSFPLLKAAQIEETAPPMDEELRILREDVDPLGYVIGR